MDLNYLDMKIINQNSFIICVYNDKDKKNILIKKILDYYDLEYGIFYPISVRNILHYQERTMNKSTSYIIIDFHNVKDESLYDLINSRKKNKLLIIFVIHISEKINSILISKADYIFMFKETEQDNIKKIYNKYGFICKTFIDFQKLLENNIMIDNNTKSENLYDFVYIYK